MTKQATVRNFLLLPKPSIDLVTLSVVFAMSSGLVFLSYAHATNIVGPLAAIVLGSLLMNLSFTAWHESSHSNLSKFSWINHTVGIFASFFSVYPGYFARRREHLAHHKWEGENGKDPVYERIQTSGPLAFPWRVIEVNYLGKGNPAPIPQDFLPLAKWQAASDKISNYSILALFLLAIYLGYGTTVLFVWVIPRVLVFVLHAYYICFFPHFISEGGYQKYRVYENSWWYRFITVEQNFHGIHHRWMTIPWHRYAAVYSACREELIAAKIEFKNELNPTRLSLETR